MSTPTTELPRLRAGVLLDVPGRALVDTVFQRRVKLDDAGLAILSALVSAASLEEVADRAGVVPEGVTLWLGRLESHDLLDGPRARARMADRQALAKVKAAPAEHLLPLEGARFACTMCGSCCGGHVVGPVSPAILKGLDPHVPAFEAEIREQRRAEKGLFFVLPGQRATPGEDVVCHSASGSCVFLDDAGLCRIHGRLGGEKKPLPCRIFPWELTATPRGVRVAVQRECRDFLAASGPDKPTLAESEAELRGLLAEIPGLWAPAPAPVLRDSKLASWDAYEALEARLHAACDEDVEGTFGRLAALVGPPGEAAPSLAAWREGMLAPMRQILAAVPASDEEVIFRVDALSLGVRALEEARGWMLMRATAPLSADEAPLFREHVRHALWSLSPLRATSIAAGLARLHAEWLLARLIALVRAREVKRFHLTVQDLQDGLASACFLSRHRDLTPVFERLDAVVVATFLDHPGAARAAAALELDRRLELPKF